MELFKLFGTIAVNNSDANKAIDDTTSKAEKSGSKLKDTFGKIGSAVGTVAKVGAAAITTVATGIGAMTSKAVSYYSDYEQLVGGVETLFKESSDKVGQYASKAYQTAGLSANDYMETVTGFSASLLQALDGDTAKATESANMAITDMSDNTNKMGTAMENIQNAYQGFAKQNYTMLDNLKLGYGGTKEEMERLLSDAQAISGIQYDISSYADVVDAIHVIQTEMGITGTTAKEASTTIQGSIGSMKAAFENFLTGMADPEQNFDALLGNLVDSVVTVADNLVPRIATTLPRLVNGLVNLVKNLASYIPDILSQLLPSIIIGATDLINGIVAELPQLINILLQSLPALIDGIVQIFNNIIAALPQMIQMLCDALPKLIPLLISAATKMIQGLCNALPEIIRAIVDALPTLIISIVDALMQNLPLLIQGLVTLITGIVDALPQIMFALIEATPTIIAMILEGLWNSLPDLLEGITSIVGSVLSSIWEVLSTIFEPLGEFFTSIWDAIITAFSTVGTWVYDNIIAPVADFFKGLWDGIVSAFHTVIDPWIEIVKRAATLVNDKIIKPIKKFFKGLWDDIVGIFKGAATWFDNTVIQPLKDIFSNIWNSIKNGASKAWEGIKSVFSPVADFFKNIFSKAWQAVKNVFSTGGKIFTGIKEGIVKAFKTVVNAIIKGINKVVSIPFKAINSVLSKIQDINILGVKPFTWVHTFDVPQIPELELATGTVVNKATPAIIGEDGAEAVVPLERHTEWIDRVAEKVVSKMGATGSCDSVLAAKMDELINYIKALKIYLNGDVLVGELAPAMDAQLGDIFSSKERGR